MRTAVLVGAGLAALLAPPLRADHYSDGRDSWLQKKYPQAYATLLEARNEPYGRRPEVDYMIGTSACRIDGFRPWGYEFLGAIPISYPLSAESRALVLQERGQCMLDAAPAPVDAADSLDRVTAAGVSGRAKVYLLPDEKVGLTTYAARRLRQIPRAEFQGRLSSPTEGGKAEESARRLLHGVVDGVSPKAQAFPRFVLASVAGHSPQQLERIASTLERFMDFIVREYRVSPPEHLITIYLVPEPRRVASLADKIHGLKVAPGTIGYAFQNDQSIVAFVPAGEGVGTVLHEMVHLAVRGNFGDIPQWLDEGLAGLYEVSTVCADRSLGEPNWRGEVLRAFWDVRPTIAELLRQEWFPFDVPEEGNLEENFKTKTGKQQAAAMATARYFALYLERKGWLRPVYLATKDRDFLKGQSAADAAQIALERAAKNSLESIDKDFVAWFGAGVKKVDAGASCTQIEKPLPSPSPGR
jgi:hypothetical protein